MQVLFGLNLFYFGITYTENDWVRLKVCVVTLSIILLWVCYGLSKPCWYVHFNTFVALLVFVHHTNMTTQRRDMTHHVGC